VVGKIVHEEPSKVSADDGAVAMHGPDAVDVQLTPEAAEETANRLTDEAVMARGQRRLRGSLTDPTNETNKSQGRRFSGPLYSAESAFGRFE
jgi:hypothetical protein